MALNQFITSLFPIFGNVFFYSYFLELGKRVKMRILTCKCIWKRQWMFYGRNLLLSFPSLSHHDFQWFVKACWVQSEEIATFQVHADVILSAIERYGPHFKSFSHLGMPYFHRSKSFHDRADGPLLLLCRSCPRLESLVSFYKQAWFLCWFSSGNQRTGINGNNSAHCDYGENTEKVNSSKKCGDHSNRLAEKRRVVGWVSRMVETEFQKLWSRRKGGDSNFGLPLENGEWLRI